MHWICHTAQYWLVNLNATAGCTWHMHSQRSGCLDHRASEALPSAFHLQGKTVEMISLMLARPRPPLPEGVDAVEAATPAEGASTSATSFKCRHVCKDPECGRLSHLLSYLLAVLPSCAACDFEAPRA